MSEPNNPPDKPYGIRTTLPEGSPFAAPHLLGPHWEAYKWYATARERDAAMEEMLVEHPWSRPGDRPAIRCTPINR